MRVEHLGSGTDVAELFNTLDVDDGGRKIMLSKARVHLLLIRDMPVGAANILKQDALSVGADLAVPKGTVVAKTPRVDALLMATERQLMELSRKELAQPFGLKDLAASLKPFYALKHPRTVEIMGIVNTNEDSFFEGSRFRGKRAVERVSTMIEEGADIIDLGAVSTRPGSEPVDAEEELARVRPVIDAIYTAKLHERVRFSIDSYTPAVIAYALEHGFRIVNDITGLADDAVCRLCAEFDATAVIMHMQGTPKTMQADPHYDDLLIEIADFFRERMQKAEAFGIGDVVLDVGIGFGKKLEHNLALIAHLEHFLALKKPLLVGASRKSMINAIDPSPVEARLPGTLALHLEAVRNGAQIVRVHDVQAHVQAVKTVQALWSS